MEEGELLFPLVTPAGEAALGGAVDSRWAFGHSETRLPGIRMRQRESVRPLSPIKE